MGNLLMDPVFFDPFEEGTVVSCPRREVDLDARPVLDAIFISHRHLDHLDLPSLAALGRALPVLCPDDPFLLRALQLLGLPPRLDDQATGSLEVSSEYEQPLLDFGDARDNAFFSGLKATSVESLVPFGPRAGLPVQRLRDADLAKAFASAGWSGQRDRLEKLCRYDTRPALCLKRLEVRSDGRISWSMRQLLLLA